MRHAVTCAGPRAPGRRARWSAISPECYCRLGCPIVGDWGLGVGTGAGRDNLVGRVARCTAVPWGWGSWVHSTTMHINALLSTSSLHPRLSSVVHRTHRLSACATRRPPAYSTPHHHPPSAPAINRPDGQHQPYPP